MLKNNKKIYIIHNKQLITINNHKQLITINNQLIGLLLLLLVFRSLSQPTNEYTPLTDDVIQQIYT